MNEEYADMIERINVFPEGKTFRIIYDSGMNMLRLLCRDADTFNDIRMAFSVENKAAFFSKQYGYRAEDRLYNINKFGYFKPGLVFRVLNWIKTQYGHLQCVAISQKCSLYINDFIKPLQKYVRLLQSGRGFDVSNISEDSGVNDRIRLEIAKRVDAGENPDEIRLNTFEFRDYQRRSIEALVVKGLGRGLIEIPTAGGKSFILGNFIYNIQKKIDRNAKFLVLVPNVQLVEQMTKDFVDYGFDRNTIAKFKGGMSKAEKLRNDVQKANIVIANRQQIFKNRDALPRFDVLIADECHQNCAKASQEFIDSLNAKIKVGCSGTIPEDKYLRNTLIGMFGEIVYRENVTDLQAAGFISKLDITVLDIFDRNVDHDRNLLFNLHTTKKYVADDFESDIKFDDAVRAEHDYFVKWYKDLYTPVLEYVSKLDGNTLVLFDKLDIGGSLFEFFREKHPGVKSFYNDGSTNVDEREDVRGRFEKTDGNVLFANVQIMSTGISIKRLHNIVFCFSSKSTTRVIQSIGRVLRLYGDKEKARLIDCVFNFKYSTRHYRERLQLYRKFYNKQRPDKIVKLEI